MLSVVVALGSGRPASFLSANYCVRANQICELTSREPTYTGSKLTSLRVASNLLVPAANNPHPGLLRLHR